jgi:hypothetical protein
MSYLSRVACIATAFVALATTATAANDPDSFGRAVRYLDVGSSSTLMYYTGTAECDATMTCIAAGDPLSERRFEETNRFTITLPSYSTHSMLCYSITPSINYLFSNQWTSVTQSRITFHVNATIESSVLRNPSLINRVTGQPFNGSLIVYNLATHHASAMLDPGKTQQQVLNYSRECQNGLISVRDLQQTYGLSAYQARALMNSQLTIRFGTVVSMRNVSFVVTRLGARLFGD